MAETDSTTKHISKIDALVQALNDIDELVKPGDKMAKVHRSLPMKYSGFMILWYPYGKTKWKYNNIEIFWKKIIKFIWKYDLNKHSKLMRTSK